MVDNITWLSHEFRVYPLDTTWNNVAGVYIFCGINTQGYWVPLYVGQTDSFKDRFSSHEKWNLATRNGATHIHARAIPHAHMRDAVELELIQKLQPRLNEQLK